MKNILLLIMLAGIACGADTLADTIKQDEGFSAKVYKDTLGNWTIGYGHLCNAGTAPITQDQANALLDADIAKAKESALKLIGDGQPEKVLNIVTQMVFQLGVGGVAQFKHMIVHIKAKSYVNASKDMLQSDWCDQTPKRCKRLAKEMRDVM